MSEVVFIVMLVTASVLACVGTAKWVDLATRGRDVPRRWQ